MPVKKQPSSLTIYIDSREKKEIHEFLKRSFKHINFVSKQLSTGDYLSDSVVIERKSIADLWASLQDGRFHDQLNRMATFANEKIVIYLIVGSIEEWEIEYESNRKLLLKRGIKLPRADKSKIDSMIASLLVRENIRVIVNTNKNLGLKQAIRMIERIENEKITDFPSNRNPDTLAARLLNISLNDWLDLKSIHGSALCHVCSLSDKELAKVPSLTPKKRKDILQILKHGW